MSYKQIFYHIVFATKDRHPAIPETHCNDLYAFIWGVIKKRGCVLHRINGMEDHLHLFSDLHPSISLADYVKEIKVSSSTWLKENRDFPNFRGWQDGYGAFTHSVQERSRIMNYAKNQKEHHKTENFFEEYKRLLVNSATLQVDLTGQLLICRAHRRSLLIFNGT